MSVSTCAKHACLNLIRWLRFPPIEWSLVVLLALPSMVCTLPSKMLKPSTSRYNRTCA